MSITVVGRTGRTVWVTDDPTHEPLFVHPESQPEDRRPLGSVLAMSQGGFTFDPDWVRH